MIQRVPDYAARPYDTWRYETSMRVLHVIPDAALISMKLWEGREKLERLRGKIGTFSARDDFGTGRRNDGDGEATHLTEN